jgi:hypothetical protein
VEHEVVAIATEIIGDEGVGHAAVGKGDELAMGEVGESSGNGGDAGVADDGEGGAIGGGETERDSGFEAGGMIGGNFDGHGCGGGEGEVEIGGPDDADFIVGAYATGAGDADGDEVHAGRERDGSFLEKDGASFERGGR